MANEGGMAASYEAFDRYPARADVAEKVVPDTDPAKEMYSRYASYDAAIPPSFAIY